MGSKKEGGLASPNEEANLACSFVSLACTSIELPEAAI